MRLPPPPLFIAWQAPTIRGVQHNHLKVLLSCRSDGNGGAGSPSGGMRTASGDDLASGLQVPLPTSDPIRLVRLAAGPVTASDRHLHVQSIAVGLSQYSKLAHQQMYSSASHSRPDAIMHFARH